VRLVGQPLRMARPLALGWVRLMGQALRPARRPLALGWVRLME
jgi:hypothetical protein